MFLSQPFLPHTQPCASVSPPESVSGLGSSRGDSIKLMDSELILVRSAVCPLLWRAAGVPAFTARGHGAVKEPHRVGCSSTKQHHQ